MHKNFLSLQLCLPVENTGNREKPILCFSSAFQILSCASPNLPAGSLENGSDEAGYWGNDEQCVPQAREDAFRAFTCEK